MHFAILQKHIDAGVPGSCYADPPALAIRAVVPEGTHVRVGGFYIKIGNKQYKTPKKLRQFISCFDAGGKVEPIEFELSI
jgi:hypothetical protein